MIQQVIQKMQELAGQDASHSYEVICLASTDDQNAEKIKAVFKCTYDEARNIEGMLNANFNLKKGQAPFVLAIKQVG